MQTGGVDLELSGQPRRFYDGGPPDGEALPEEPPTIVLERSLDMAVHEFRMTRRLGYRDRHLGDLLVPADTRTFVTDLTSVPAVFGWLVPRTGRHLPAALLHDGLVGAPGEPVSYISASGADIDREEANRVFRDAMADTGTGVVRRWLMWTAVTVVTMVVGTGTRWSAAERWRWRLTAVASLGLVVGLGVLATLDLFDWDDGPLPGVPWMGDRDWWVELLAGAAGAITLPLLLGLAWGRFRIAGVVAGVSLALLLHVTVVIALLTGLYRGVESLAGARPRAALALGGVVAVGAGIVWILALAS